MAGNIAGVSVALVVKPQPSTLELTKEESTIEAVKIT